MEKNKNKIFILLIVIATTLFGQVYIKPFGTDFRVSIAIIVLTVLLLKFETVPILLTCSLTGISILLFRVGLEIFSNNVLLIDVLTKHFPSAMYYFIFGTLLSKLKIRNLVSKPSICLVVIAISDIGANISELAIRKGMVGQDLELIFKGIILSGLIRACISYLLYLSEKLYSLIIVGREQREKYKEFVVMRANIKSEIFFMQKSMEDIENSMKDSFSLYRMLNNKTDGVNQEEVVTMKNKVLGISKGIHEIKKDYTRIITGMGNVVPDLGFTPSKNSDEILEILEEVTNKYIRKCGKDISFDIKINRNFYIYEYSALISILNNLIINSIDAISSKGRIQLEIEEKQSTIDFTLIDNGVGIKDKNKEAIFNPGFSTKFDKRTGNMSTGIGLTHVKHIVERSFDGTIEVISSKDRFTKFVLILSRQKLCYGGNDE